MNQDRPGRARELGADGSPEGLQDGIPENLREAAQRSFREMARLADRLKALEENHRTDRATDVWSEHD